MTEDVNLYVYELTNGLAKQFSYSLLGKQIDGVYHTGIVVFGREYYFGGGIQCEYPGASPAGPPHQIISLGKTRKTKEEFEEWLLGVDHEFRPETYHLLKNNCNHFTSKASQFLVGHDIPKHIVNLPQEAMDSPLGKMLEPMINSFHDMFMTPPIAPPTSSGASITAPPTSGIARTMVRLADCPLEKLFPTLLESLPDHFDPEFAERTRRLKDSMSLDLRQTVIGGMDPIEVLEVLFYIINALPAEKTFPAWDLIRLLVLRPEYSNLVVFVYAHAMDDMIKSVFENTTLEHDDRMIIATMSVFVNLLHSPEGADFIRAENRLETIISRLCACLESTGHIPLFFTTAGDLITNIANILHDEDLDERLALVSACAKFAMKEKEAENHDERKLRRILRSLRLLIASSSEALAILVSVDFNASDFETDQWSASLIAEAKMLHKAIEHAASL